YCLRKPFDPDFSYALNPEFTAGKPTVKFEVKKGDYRLSSNQLTCHISKKGLKVKILDKKGFCLSEDSEGFYAYSTILKGLTEVAITKTAPADEAYYGLGDKAGKLNLRGRHYSNWTTDAFAFNQKSSELYRAIPFYYGLHQGKAYGIFVDNSYRTHFNFDSAQDGKMRFSADGGEMNYYFIYGPKLLEVCRQYMQLTGRPELPPMWALGYHQCRWSYYPESRVREIANEFRNLKIPCDAIYLDIDYMDGYRCFTWNKGYFPKPAKMIGELQKHGFQTVVMIDPGIRYDEDYAVCKSGLEEEVFCKRPDGDLMTGPVWPPECVFPDFTSERVRLWWGDLYKELYAQQGIAGFWNDMNEPAVFEVNKLTFPDDVRHEHDGHPCSHKKAHNIYGLNMSKATYDGLKKLKPNHRPFVLTRATFSGGQRYAAAWTGDNIASWKHLRLANRQCQRMSVSGFSFIGSDIGGFVDQPDGELFVRWLQLGIFHPLFRVHSMGNNVDGAAEADSDAIKQSEAENRMDQEPWVFGDKYTSIARQAIELRYRLLPYIYTTFRQYCQDGTPMIQSLFFYDQEDPILQKIARDFLFGPHLLISPVVRPGIKTQAIYLPKGTWYDYWSGKAYKGQQAFRTKIRLKHIPMFVKAGAVISQYPIRQHTGEKVTALHLRAYYSKATVESHLYEDAGEGYAYEKQKGYRLLTFTSSGKSKQFQIRVQQEGKYSTSHKKVLLHLYGLPFVPKSIKVDGKPMSWQKVTFSGQKTYILSLKGIFKGLLAKG
ncbi:MAG: TIM-barrel domain-containing protein, partial [Bacteroidota bacterium]